ncbi:sigma-70 family RNA polymerase sigma factor [Singulisphaera sp. PoT]|uniref:sigma-70 family RNA polymerase sigma factor n=1 Tax=Singulisphaera sp. PoT TaxID=3411797 RepID=UPI003BF5F50A
MGTAQLGVAIGDIHRLFDEGTSVGSSDATLLERFADGGDERAFAILVERHGPMVLGTCRAVLKDAHLAEDAFQAAFLVLVKKARSIRGHDALGGWLHRVAYRIALQAHGDLGRRRIREQEAGALAASRRPAGVFDDEAGTILHAELENLPEKHRLPLILCDLQGLTRQQAALQLGWTEWVVRHRLERGRELLRHRLTRRGFALTVPAIAANLSRSAHAAIPNAWAAATVRLAVATLGGSALPASTAALTSGLLAPLPWIRGKLAIALAISLAGAAIGWAGVGGPIEDAKGPRPKAASALALREVSTPAREDQAEARDDLVIRGTVVGPDGKPVSGAVVRYDHRPTDDPKLTRARAKTTADGRFTLNAPGAKANEAWGKRPVVASAPGFGFATGKPTGDADLRLQLSPDDAPIEGRILDLQNRPVANAKVHLKRVYLPRGGTLDTYLAAWKVGGDIWKEVEETLFDADMAELPGTVTTDGEGRFRYRGLGRERVVEFDVSGPGIEQTEVEVLTRPGLDARALNADATETRANEGRPNLSGIQVQGATFSLLVAPGRSLSGTVRDRDGNPVAGATVRASGDSEGHYQDISTTTDAQGRYSLDGLAVGVRIRGDAFVPQKSPFVPVSRSIGPENGNAQATLDFTLERGVTVRGKVVDHATGKPVSGNDVLLIYRPRPGNTFYENTPSGDWMNHVMAGNPVNRDGTFELVVGPGPGAMLIQLQGTLRDRYLDWRQSPSKANESGKKQVGAISMAYFHSYTRIDPKLDDPGPPCEIRLEPSIRRPVRLIDPEGHPLAGARVSGLTNSMDEARELASSDFEAEGLDPNAGRCLLASHPDRSLAGFLSLKGNAEGPGTLKLEPWATVCGRLVDAQGEPMSGVRLGSYYTDGQGSDMSRSEGLLKPKPQSDADGRFRLPGLVPGLQATLTFAKKERIFEGQKTAADLTLKPGETRDLGDIVIKPYP